MCGHVGKYRMEEEFTPHGPVMHRHPPQGWSQGTTGFSRCGEGRSLDFCSDACHGLYYSSVRLGAQE